MLDNAVLVATVVLILFLFIKVPMFVSLLSASVTYRSSG